MPNLHDWAVYFGQLGYAVIIFCTFVIVASFIGAYVLRLLRNTPSDIPEALNLIVRGGVPSTSMLCAGIAGAAVTAFAFYSEEIRRLGDLARKRRFMVLLGGLIGLIFLDLCLQDLRLYEMAISGIVQIPTDLLIIQCISALTIFAAKPLYAEIVIINQPYREMTAIALRREAELRLIAISLAIIYFCVWFTRYNLTFTPELPSEQSLHILGTRLTHYDAVALTTSAIVAALFYHLPAHYTFPRHTVLVRFLLVLIGLISTGFIYGVTSNPDRFIVSAVIALMTAVVLVPLQRALN